MADDLFNQQLDALLRELKNLPGNIERGALRKAHTEMAEIIANAISMEAPIADEPRTVTTKKGVKMTLRPGALRDSVRPSKTRTRRGELSTRIRGLFYARFIEFGYTHMAWGKKEIGHRPPNPFIKRAIDSSSQWALDVGRRTLFEEIKKRVDRLAKKAAQMKARESVNR